jgi:hypothetical protein
LKLYLANVAVVAQMGTLFLRMNSYPSTTSQIGQHAKAIEEPANPIQYFQEHGGSAPELGAERA